MLQTGMSAKLLGWLLAGHLIGVMVWVGGMFTTYWLLRFHAHAPREVHEKLTLMERSIAMMSDLGAMLALGCGLAMALGQTPNLFKRPGSGWFHIKLAILALVVFPVHGMLRARVRKFAAGKITPVPAWQWTALLASITAIAILVFVVRAAMAGAL